MKVISWVDSTIREAIEEATLAFLELKKKMIEKAKDIIKVAKITALKKAIEELQKWADRLSRTLCSDDRKLIDKIFEKEIDDD